MPARRQRTESPDQVEMLSPSQLATELGIDERTVRRWAAANVIPAEHTRTGQHRLPATLVPTLQQLIREKVPLNARTLREHFSQQPPYEEVRAQQTAS